MYSLKAAIRIMKAEYPKVTFCSLELTSIVEVRNFNQYI